jgi:hypothetical protein
MIYVVAGLGRCGTTLMMRMLHAGGMIPAVDNTAAYEHDSMENAIKDIDTFEGKLVKWLEPQRFKLPAGKEYKIIWMVRDPIEQAKSQAKFLQVMTNLVTDRSSRRKSVEQNIKHTSQCLQMFKDRKIQHVVMKFENVVLYPKDSAILACEFLKLPLDVSKMVQQVIKRHPDCAPGLDIEARFTNEEKIREWTKWKG